LPRREDRQRKEVLKSQIRRKIKQRDQESWRNSKGEKQKEESKKRKTEKRNREHTFTYKQRELLKLLDRLK